jgi:ABC-type hemin transport system substrate-binding protein
MDSAVAGAAAEALGRIGGPQAIIRIAGAISAEHPAQAAAALKKVLVMSISPDARRSAETALKKIL